MKKIFFTALFLSSMLCSINAQVTIDGNTSDWDKIPILSEPGVFPFAKTINENGKLFFMFKLDAPLASGWNIIDIYLDADLKATTGMKSDWLYTHSGIDYLVQGSDIFEYSGAPGTNAWSWKSITGNNAERQASADNKSIELSLPVTALKSKSLESSYSVAIPYYNSTWTTGDPSGYLPANDWNFSERKAFTVKARTELRLGASAEFTAPNAYYHSFMKDANIAQYLDFQSGAYSSDNPKHWASWALDLSDPAKYDMQMISSATASGKIELSLVNRADNKIVKTFSEIWYPANASMTTNSYASLDLSDVPAGKYMLKLRHTSDWDSGLKVEKISLSKTGTGLAEQNYDSNAILRIEDGMLHISTQEPTEVKLLSIEGKLLQEAGPDQAFLFPLKNGSYIVSLITNTKKQIHKITVQ